MAADASDYPTNADSIPRTNPSDNLTGHSDLHDKMADAIEEIQGFVGVSGDTTAGTIVKRVSDLEAAPPAHNHDATYYTETEVDTLLAGKLNTGATAADSNKLGGTLASGYSTTGHTHSYAAVGHTHSYAPDTHNHNTAYLAIAGKAADSEKLDNLDSTQFLRSDTSDSFTGSTLTLFNADLRFSRSSVYSVDMGVSNSSNSNRGLVTFFSGSNQQDVQVADLFYGGALNNNSSITLKENVNDFTGATEILDQLRPVSFEYIKDDDDRTHVGLIAEEVREVFPLAIGGDSDCPTINQSSILGLAIAGLCEANARITALEARIAELEG